jgi:hypothetical protein
MHVTTIILCFAFREVIKELVFCTIHRKQSSRLSVFGTEHIYLFLSVFIKHQRAGV